MSKFLIRLDDIHPEMNHNNFQRMIDLMTGYGIKGILGVIPDNRDEGLQKSKVDPDFWDKVKTLENNGFWIAQHGYQHLYDSFDGGILKLNNQSEFSGHSYIVQENKMEKGKVILENKGLNPRLFMAPSHSFDYKTIEVIKKVGYAITDGYGLFPKKKEGVLHIPQLFASPRHIGVGLYTICLHTDQMKDPDFNKLENHLKKHNSDYISPDEIQKHQIKENDSFLNLIDSFFGILIKLLLSIKRQKI